MSIIFELDPVQDDNMDCCDDRASFNPVLDLFDQEISLLDMPDLSPKFGNIDNLCAQKFTVVNTFKHKREKMDDDDTFDNTAEHKGNYEFYLEKVISTPKFSSLQQKEKEGSEKILPNLTQLASEIFIDSSMISKTLDKQSKSLGNSSESQSKRRKRRKPMVAKRDAYKKRKDVIMKGVLRRCRKFYQESYSLHIQSNPELIKLNCQVDLDKSVTDELHQLDYQTLSEY